WTAAALYKFSLCSDGRAAQLGARRHQGPLLFRSWDLRTLSKGHGRPEAVLRHVQNSDLAQYRRAARVLSQRGVPDLAAGDGFLQFSRHQPGEGLSACSRREGPKIQRHSSAISRQCECERAALQPQTGPGTGDDRTGTSGHNRISEDPERRIQAGNVKRGDAAWLLQRYWAHGTNCRFEFERQKVPAIRRPRRT